MKSTHTFFRITLILIFLSVGLTSCTLFNPSLTTGSKTRYREPFIPTDIPPTPPYFIAAECRFPVPPGEVRCGDLYVSEDRSDPNSRVISLHVGVFPSFSPNPEPDPLIYLTGGGGADTLSSAKFYLGIAGTMIRTNRDYILYNQRGVKYNDPYLACPDEDQFWEQAYSQNLAKGQLEELEIQFLKDCQQHLVEEGVNTDLYDSLAHAADLADLITALGYNQANIYGVSYGTRTGLTLMRHHPDLIRSAILDGVLPPQINYPSDVIPGFKRALGELFSACKQQPGCSEAYPDLEGDLNSTLEALLAEPATLNIYDRMVSLDHSLFLEAVHRFIYSSATLAEFPAAIHNASLGNFSWFYDTLHGLTSYSEFITSGVNYATICRDEVFFDSPENNQDLASQFPETWQDFLDLSIYYTTCQEWVGEPADPIENTPVVSDIPTLILAGHFDPITSPAWGQETAGYLENSFYYEFPDLAHGVLGFSSCGLKIGQEFLNDPQTEPDTSCLEELEPPVFK